ncbi:MAG: hypothetical protein KF726_04005 [Anaerolineae bacterium]|nr:hypothetical protein [Anaerolineae bacterium]
MRAWNLKAGSPLAMRFAADARLTRTDYADDQSWEISFGEGDQPALTFQTRYGARAGIVRLVPMFIFKEGPVYEAQAYAESPTLVNFTPSFARLSAKLRPNLGLTTDLWLIDSHTVGGSFTFDNQSAEALTLRLDLLAQAMREEQSVRMHLLALEDGHEALHLGNIGGLNPVLLLEGVSIYNKEHEGARPKLSASITIPAGETKALKWLVSGEKMRQDSLTNGYNWLFDSDWSAALQRAQDSGSVLPIIETGDADLDATLAFSAHVLLRSFISPTKQMPNPTFVTVRTPARGFSPSGDGRDHNWAWNGQSIRAGYLALPAVAQIDPALALSVYRNWIATAQPDGWIEAKPGAAGQRSDRLCPPLLTALAWKLYENTGDQAFLAEVYSPLRKFLDRWFAADRDVDQDGVPEWQDESHSGYSPNPMFGASVRWGQGADIRYAETSDLAAQLIHEANALIQIAELLDKPDDLPALRQRVDSLTAQLAAMWNDSAGVYLARDRDTNETTLGSALFRGKGDEAFDARPQLDPPNRLLLRVIGGTNRPPSVTITIEGLDHAGKPAHEEIVATDLNWIYGSGSVASCLVYSQVNYVKFSGLSRVYSTEINTVDLTRHNLTHLLPLWSHSAADHADRIKNLLTDPAQYGRAHGLTICPASDPAFAANNENGSGGVSLFWNTLLLEGLLDNGYSSDARDLLHRLLNTVTAALKRDHSFFEQYNSDTGAGIGEIDGLMGIVPLELFLRCIGVRVVDSRHVWVGGTFLLDQPVKLSIKGVEIVRSAEKTSIKFPSGHETEVDSAWQQVADPTPEEVKPMPLAPVLAPVPAVIVPGEAKIEIETLDSIVDSAAERAPKPTPLITISDPEAPDVPVIEAAPRVDIPVISKKDDTMEVPIDQPDSDKPNPPDSAAGGTIKIPVKSE